MKGIVAAGTLIPLAIGIAAKVTPAIKTAAATSSHGRSKVCAVTLLDCPDAGCADPDKPDGLTNILKHRFPSGAPHALTVADFRSLQEQAEKRVGSKEAFLTKAQHAKLHDMSAHGATVSDGDVVVVAGYIVGDPHHNTGESVNCGLRDAPNNDIHITIAKAPGSDEMDGFVVEMIPQDRPDAWNKEALQAIEQERRQVLVTGQLFYDSKHRVNDNPDDPISGQPRRMSLWEIHPITAFSVCTAGKVCDPKRATDWTALEKYQQRPAGDAELLRR